MIDFGQSNPYTARELEFLSNSNLTVGSIFKPLSEMTDILNDVTHLTTIMQRLRTIISPPFIMEILQRKAWFTPAIHYVTPTSIIFIYHTFYVFESFRKSPDGDRQKTNKLISLRASPLIFILGLGIIGSYWYQSFFLTKYLLSTVPTPMNGKAPPDHLVIYSIASAMVWSVVFFNGQLSARLLGILVRASAIFQFVLLSSAPGIPNQDDFSAHISTVSMLRFCLTIALSLAQLVLTRKVIREQPESGKKTEDEAAGPDAWDDGDWEEDEELERLMRSQQKDRFKASATWWEYLKPFKMLLPHILPRRDAGTIMMVIMLAVCIVMERVLPPLLTSRLGIITDDLLLLTSAAPSSTVDSTVLVRDVSIWLILTLLSSSGGVYIIEEYVRGPLEWYSTQSTTLASYDHMMSLSAEFHNSMNPAGMMNSVAVRDNVYRVFHSIVSSIIPSLLDIVIGGVYVYSLFGPYAAFTYAVAGYVFTLLDTYYQNLELEYVRETNKGWVKLCNIQTRAMEGWRTVRSFNTFAYERDRLNEAIEADIDNTRKLRQLRVWESIFVGNVMTIALIPVSFVAIQSIRAGTAPVGHFVAMTSIWLQLSTPLARLSSKAQDLMSSLVNMERLLYVLSIKPAIEDAPDAKPLVLTKGDVTFEDVSFAYDVRRPVLEHLNLNDTAGKTIALVGGSGGGKTTILSLISRLYDVRSGAIRIDGQDVRSITQESLREAIGAVPQSPFLFHMSILDNLRYARISRRGISSSASSNGQLSGNKDDNNKVGTRIGVEEAGAITKSLSESDEDKEEMHIIEAACRAASIHERIITFPQGYNTLVGENGIKLSGGEQQRIAIAQVLLKDPRLVLLDEATSAVDTITERQIQAALKELVKGRTAFVIAHRLSTIVGADLILVLDGGKVIESGCHDDLLSREGGAYRNLWNNQINLPHNVKTGSEGTSSS